MQKVLIVEDEEQQRLALQAAIDQRGYTSLVARDGVEGLAMALREHPDVVLTDIRMPAMDGLAMMHKLRGDKWGNKVPIVILTNYDNTDAQLNQINIDAPAYYLVKVNNTVEQIMDKIQGILEVGQES